MTRKHHLSMFSMQTLSWWDSGVTLSPLPACSMHGLQAVVGTSHIIIRFAVSVPHLVTICMLKPWRGSPHMSSNLGLTVSTLIWACSIIPHRLSSFASDLSTLGLSDIFPAWYGVTQEFIFPARLLRGKAQAKYNLNNLQENCAVLLSAAVFENCLPS